MSGYSEIIQVMGAMVIFSLILLSSNAMILRNGMFQVEGELEREVIALGQEIIEESLTKSFDRVTVGAEAPPAQIPGGFTPADQLGRDPENTPRSQFTWFDEYHGWSDTFVTAHGEFEVSAEVFYVDPVQFEQVTGPTTFKKIEVTVQSRDLTRDGEPIRYRLEFIRNYYAD